MLFALLGFGLTWDLSNPCFFLISPFWNGNVYAMSAPHHWILEAYNLFRFTVYSWIIFLQLEVQVPQV